MRNLYLIQRGTINRPIAPLGKRLSEAVRLDYMGSAEFEFGALPKSFRAMDNSGVSVSEAPTISDRGHTLMVLHPFKSDEDFAAYCSKLADLRDPNSRTRCKEWHGFKEGFGSKPWERGIAPDFWWDIDNHVMWSFDHEFMSHASDYVKSSLAYMKAQASN